jgi:HK97 family phage major capsid protein
VKTIQELLADNTAAERTLERAISLFEALPESATPAEIQLARDKMGTAERELAVADNSLEAARLESGDTHRRQHIPVDDDDAGERRQRIRVDEPDMYYRAGGPHRFLSDLYAKDLRGDLAAGDRLAHHHAYEAEKRAVSTGTLGGIIPPQYLVDLYAKAPRNGRVFVDQCNRDDPLPDEGMSLIIPRLTQGAAAGVQATEGDTVDTQDPTETDLTIPVCTISGYLPVSRQTLERASYSEAILFEDLIARYWSALDVQALSGSGSGGEMRGVFHTSGLSSSTAWTATIAGVWPKLADVIQQINTAMGGLGYYADKIVMHPRRWGFFEAALDQNDRPVFGITGTENYAPNAIGDAAGYGYVGRMHGLPVYTDANLPTNQGAGTNQDAILIMASRVVHAWEADDGRPMTLRFEQQEGTALKVQLVAYGYAGFTAGRYPAAVGTVEGAGLVAPTF